MIGLSEFSSSGFLRTPRPEPADSTAPSFAAETLKECRPVARPLYGCAGR